MKTPEQIEIAKYCRKYRKPDGRFKLWGSVASVGIRGTIVRRTSLQDLPVELVRPNISAVHLLLPWIFDELRFDVEHILALGAMTNNFEGFPGEWYQFKTQLDKYTDLCGFVGDHRTPDVRLRRLWINSGRDMSQFRILLEPFRIRSGRATGLVAKGPLFV